MPAGPPMTKRRSLAGGSLGQNPDLEHRVGLALGPVEVEGEPVWPNGRANRASYMSGSVRPSSPGCWRHAALRRARSSPALVRFREPLRQVKSEKSDMLVIGGSAFSVAGAASVRPVPQSRGAG
jgi:hypothetical protein